MSNIRQNLLEKCSILLPFTSGYAGEFHASELARFLGLEQRTVARKLDYLEKQGLLRFKRSGKNKYYSLDLRLPSSLSLLVLLENYKELLFGIEHPALSPLFKELPAGVVLFGSYAKGRAKEHSDLDCIIFSERTKEIEVVMQRYPLEINAHFFPFAHFKKMLRDGEPLAKEVFKDHVLLGEKERIIRLFRDYCLQ